MRIGWASPKAQTSRDDFEIWLSDMGDALERFGSLLPNDLRNRLVYSIDSLDALESRLLSRYQDPRELLEKRESTYLDGLSRYVGEVFRKNLSARSDIGLKNETNTYLGLPKLVGYSKSLTLSVQ